MIRTTSDSRIECGEGDSFLIPHFVSDERGNEILAEVDRSITYLSRDDPRMKFKIYGKTLSLPRDKAVYGEIKMDERTGQQIEPFYRYAKDTPPVEDWKDTILKTVADDLIQRSGQECNHVVVNQYRNGKDYIGFHHDKSKTFVMGSSVMVLSLGASRTFRLQKKVRAADGTIHRETINLQLKHGSLFVMGPATNLVWKHSIVQELKINHRRVSLTYRWIEASRIHMPRSIQNHQAEQNLMIPEGTDMTDIDEIVEESE